MTELEFKRIQESETLSIPGLTYIPNYISIDEQNQLLNAIDQQVWSLESLESRRRIQQHGYKYEYQNGILVACNYLGDLPEWADSIACFGDTIITLSLGSSYVMNLMHLETGEMREVLLSQGSLLVLKQEARYGWLHSVLPRYKDIYQGREVVRSRRISLTFREALFPHK
jgi:alkylated DNA repair dioxygenase AlkB